MVTILLEQILELLKGWLTSFTTWAEGVATTLGLIEEQTEYIDDIYDDTEAIKTDTGNIATSNQIIVSNTQGINNRLQSIDPNVTAIKNNVGTISTNTGIAAAFSEDIATNTLNTLDKVTTIASDTTQMRSNTNNISTDVDEIKTLLRYFSAGLIMEEDTEGPIASCDTDLTDYLVNCKCGFSTTKANNVLSGVSSINVTKTGKNLCPNQNMNTTSQTVVITTDTNGVISLNGTATANAAIRSTSFLLKAGTYIYSDNAVGTFPSNGSTRSQLLIEGTTSIIANINNISALDHEVEFTLLEDTLIYFRVRVNGNTTYNNNLIKPMVRLKSSIDKDFEPYKATSSIINFGNTYYGGELDALNGRLKVTHGYIASYNGETINEPWISSLDDYVPNTSPTTGAEVVYPLTNPYYVAVNNITIRTLKGINNVYNDCDNTFVTYKESVKHYLEKQEG